MRRGLLQRTRDRMYGRFALLAALAVALAVPESALQADETLRDPETARAWLLSALEAPFGPPSISVAVAVGDEIVLADAVGYADLATEAAATPETTYRAYSISKAITAVALMQLVESGELSLSEDIRDSVPAFPEKRWPVLLEHLASHTSGVRHYKEGAGEISSTTEYPTLADSLVVFADDPLLFEPGTAQRYTSFGFNLLTGAIEAATGGSFEDYLRRAVFEPAGMRSSSLAVEGADRPRLASPYWRPREESEPNWPIDELPNVSGRYGSSGVISTPTDLVRLFLALNRGDLMERATLEQMLSPPYPEIDSNQAYGWSLELADGRRAVYSSGAGTGYTSALVHYPAEGVTAALMSNQNQFRERWALLEELAAAYFPD